MSRFINPVPQFLDDAGEPLPLGKIYFYEPGTTTLKDTYADVGLSIANTNPVILDGSGRAPNIFLSGVYTAKLTNADESQEWAKDSIGTSTDAQWAPWDSAETYSAGDIVQGSDGEYYKSSIDNNLNKDPTTNPASWGLVSIDGATVIITVVTATDAAWTPATNTSSIEFTAIGGGGGGGGINRAGAGEGASSGGGGGGGWTTKATNSVETSYNITIGAGGAAGDGTPTSGSTGGSTTISSSDVNLTATGGSGGQGKNSTTGNDRANGGAGGVGSGGTINMVGGSGTSGFVVGGIISCLGDAGASFLGGVVRGKVDTDGTDGVNYGAGGGGSAADASNQANSGGAGAGGAVIIKEYF